MSQEIKYGRTITGTSCISTNRVRMRRDEEETDDKSKFNALFRKNNMIAPRKRPGASRMRT